MAEKVETVIVGAGAAGLAAGCRLLEKGITDFVVLEALNRIGGRVHSIPYGRGSLDIGAEWVHGEQGNVVYEMASHNDLLYRSDSPFEKSTIFRSDGRAFEKNLSDELLSILDDIIDNHPKDIRAYKGSLGDFFVERYWPKVEPLISEGKLTRADAADCLQWLEYVENSIDGSPSWFETAANEAVEYVKLPGCVLNTWKLGGYGTVLDLISCKLPNPESNLNIEKNIRLSKPVTNIDYSRSRVIITCADGSQFNAERVIVTVSLNVLKATASDIFQPALPSINLNAIQGLGMGTVDKIFLEFPYRWWSPLTGGVSLVWRAEDAAQVPKELWWTTGVLGFYGEDNHPLSTLCGWIVGAHAEAMEAASDEVVMKECVALLRRFAGRTVTVPDAISIHRSQWHTNPYVRGSYTCRMIQSDKMDVWPRHLAQPVCNKSGKPVLLFAGEATHDKFFSTVHGAIETGRREADRVLNLRQIEKIESPITIVGAGLAGLAAAKTLIAAGLKVIVLEAQSSPGGRIRSLATDWGSFELGAQWLHGEGTEVHRLASENGLISDIVTIEGMGRYCRPDGSEVPSNLVKEIDDVITNILKQSEQYKNANEYPSSIGEELRNKFSMYLQRSDIRTMHDKKEIFRWHQLFQLIDNSCDDLENLSAKAWGLYEDCGDNHCINLNGAFSVIIDILMKSLPEGTVRLSTPVRRVIWAECVNSPATPRAKVVCDNLQVVTNHVIVTSSLGYLKEHKDSMFCPSLPAFHSKVIELLGFGTIAKLYLAYEQPWWSPDDKGFQLVWTECPDLLAAVPWAVGAQGFDVLDGKPVLLGWIGGPAATIVENIPEAKLKEQTTELLRRFTGNSKIPHPKSVYRSNWSSNEFTRGSYSHVTSDCDTDNINCGSLAQPVYTKVKNGNLEQVPTILLAGEACHVSHYSTVHGAYESGQQQAQVIINHIRQNAKL